MAAAGREVRPGLAMPMIGFVDCTHSARQAEIQIAFDVERRIPGFSGLSNQSCERSPASSPLVPPTLSSHFSFR